MSLRQDGILHHNAMCPRRASLDCHPQRTPDWLEQSPCLLLCHNQNSGGTWPKAGSTARPAKPSTQWKSPPGRHDQPDNKHPSAPLIKYWPYMWMISCWQPGCYCNKRHHLRSTPSTVCSQRRPPWGHSTPNIRYPKISWQKGMHIGISKKRPSGTGWME